MSINQLLISLIVFLVNFFVLQAVCQTVSDVVEQSWAKLQLLPLSML